MALSTAFIAVVAVGGGTELVATPRAVAAESGPDCTGIERTAADGVSAMLNARLSGCRIEDLSQRTETSATYARPDGDWDVAMSMSPVWVRTGGDGTHASDWAEFDADLREDDHGVFVPQAHPARVEISGTQQAGADGVSVVASLTDPATSIVSELTFPGDLPAPEVTGPRARYRSVSPGIDMVIDVTGGGVEQYYVLHELPADGEDLPVGLQVSGEGAQVIDPATEGPGPGALVEVLDSTEDVVASVGTPVMWDATYDAQLAHPVAEDYDGSAEPATWAGSVQALDESDNASDEVERAGLGKMAQSAGRAISDAFSGGPEPLDLGVAAEVPAQVDVREAGADIAMDADAGLEDAGVAPEDVVLPLVVDPSVSLALPWDTYVQSDSSVEKSNETELRLGTFDGGTTKARTYMNVSTSSILGKSVRSASLKLWEWHSYSCNAREWVAYPAGLADGGTVWSDQPNINTSYSGSSTETTGHSASCGDGWVNMDVTDILRYFSRGAASERGISLRAANESDSYGWKRFNSTNASSGKPTLTVTLNTAPAKPGSTTLASGQYAWYPSSTDANKELYVKTLTPTFRAVVSDPDGDRVRSSVKILEGSTEVLTDGVGSYVASGGTSKYTTKTSVGLANGHTYSANVRAYDGLLMSATKSLWNFKVDTTKPATPAVTATGYTNGEWKDTKPSSNTFTFTSTSSDVTRFEYSADGGPWTSKTASGTTTKTATHTWNPAEGAHTLKVRAVDKAAWTSAVTTFTFGAGGADITAPTSNGTKSTSTVPVSATAPAPASGSVTAEVLWRVGGGQEPADFSPTNGSRTGWTAVEGELPVTTAAGAVTATGLLDVAGIASELGRDRQATMVNVQVCFTYTSPATTRCSWTSTPSSHATATYVPHAFDDDFPTAAAGPGQVALWTGEYAMHEHDAAVADLAVGRSYASYDNPAASAGVFGPGWTSSFIGDPVGTSGLTAKDDTTFDGTISFTDGYGSPMVFMQPGTGRAPRQLGVYAAADDDTAALGVRIEVLAPDAQDRGTRLTWTDSDGSVTTWAWQNGTWQAISVDGVDSPGIMRLDYDGAGRLTRMVAPVPQAATPVTCDAGAEQRGCRVLSIAYGSSDTGTDAVPGDRAGQVKQISYTAWDPATNAVTTTPVAAYAYNSSGYLVKVTDPRSNLSTTYAYSGVSSAGVPLLASVTPAGLASWTLQYGPTTVDANALVTVTRDGATLGASSVRTSRYVYGIDPATTVAGLPAMTGAAVAVWGQPDAPTYGAAVFAQDKAADVPGSSTGDVTAALWPYADVFYTDDQGRVTNAAQYGAGDWQLTSTTYDESGRAVRTLEPGAIAQIRGSTTAGEEVDPDTYATITTYNQDVLSSAAATGPDGESVPAGTVLLPAGTLATDILYPASDVVDPATGDTITARAHVKTAYDQSAPNNGVNPETGLGFGLATTTQILQEPVGEASGAATVVAETRTGYAPIDGADELSETSGWVLGSPTSTTTENGSTDITSKVRFDALGRVVEKRQPKGSGADAGTILTGYYTADSQAGPFADCGGRPEWDGLLCRTRSAETTATIPVATVEYGYLLNQTKLSEVKSSATRTTTQSYLADGRDDTTTVTASGLTDSEPVPTTKTIYDTATGLPTATASLDASDAEIARISQAYDRWGRLVTYTDTDGQVTTTTYDAAGAVASVTDPVGTTTYTTDSATEHRGLTVGVDLDGKGQIDATYDAAGNITTQSMPGQVTMTKTYDQAGQLTGMSYDTTDSIGDPLTLGTWTIGRELLGRIATQDTNLGTGADGSFGRSLAYAYDKAQRLTDVTDTLGACTTTRTYGFDTNGNRTSQTTVEPTLDAGGACTTASTITTAKSWTYDPADRVQDGATLGGATAGAYGYDALGRQRLIPAVDTPAGSAAGNLTIEYYDTDAVHTITQDGVTTTYGLDPAGRRATQSVTSSAGATTTERHYTDVTDNPGWAKETTPDGQSATTWYAPSATGELAATVTDGQLTLALTDPHGDGALSFPVTSTERVAISAPPLDEYGNPVGPTATPGSSEPLGYHWMATDERATSHSGLNLMGARVYNPTTGAFTSVDPVTGGNSTAYVYPQDPVNDSDVSGTMSTSVMKKIRELRACLNLGASNCYVAYRITVLVIGYASGFRNRDKQNGIRHFVWSALLAMAFGGGNAKKLTDSHEWRQYGRDSAVDQRNNYLGRLRGIWYRTSSRAWWVRNSTAVRAYWLGVFGNMGKTLWKNRTLARRGW
ncbi:DNRLRE domain-containing protein [Myceligenerans salitolerans]|uniref:DNRLRE domain-containing protein n=1 Tax=Myceligenerans salitolerans TaxID=1230528 RepID=A0ABS3IB89_9MICO|nr:DNRLRE domain-containing protein [Myceligenerans salitolerans]MBO0609886.1 DNRLRE domain-containing protein [Myceligenerans salitolerans]